MNLIMPILQFLSKKNAYLIVHKFILIQNLDNEISSCKGLDKKKDIPKKKKPNKLKTLMSFQSCFHGMVKDMTTYIFVQLIEPVVSTILQVKNDRF